MVRRSAMWAAALLCVSASVSIGGSAAAAGAGVPTEDCLYLNVYTPTTFSFPFPPGDAHAAELQYVFGKIPSLDITPPFSAAQLTLSAQMMRYWSRFAATGNPNGGGAPYWPAFDPASPRMEELTSTGTAAETTFGAYHHCAFWNQIKG